MTMYVFAMSLFTSLLHKLSTLVWQLLSDGERQAGTRAKFDTQFCSKPFHGGWALYATFQYVLGVFGAWVCLTEDRYGIFE